MNTELLRPITSKEVDTYHHDGVLLLKNMFDKDWIEPVSYTHLRAHET